MGPDPGNRRPSSCASPAEGERFFHSLADGGRALIWVADTEKSCVYFNRPWLNFTGRTLEQESGAGWTEGVHPDDLDACLATFNGHFDVRTPFTMEYRLRRADGAWRWILDEGSPRFDLDGEFIGYVGFCYDVTDRREAEDELKAALDRLRTLEEALDCVPVAVYMKDRQARYTYANRMTQTLFGVSAAEVQGQADTAFFPPETVAWLEELDARVLAGESTEAEVEVDDPVRGHRVYWEVKTPVRYGSGSGEPDGLLGISTDITLQKEYARRMEHLAHYDALTGLPNRTLLLELLDKGMAQAGRRGVGLAVVFLDLDGFKAVNDRFGHAFGDRLLCTVSARIQDCLRSGDTLGRLSGDEFVAILVDLPDAESALPVLDRLLEAARHTIGEGAEAITVTASLGLAHFRGGTGMAPDQLLREADQAMYTAKKAGKDQYHLLTAPSFGDGV